MHFTDHTENLPDGIEVRHLDDIVVSPIETASMAIRGMV